MKASELISALQNMINQHGDLEVYADTPPNINENTTIEDLQAYQIKRVLFDNIILDVYVSQNASSYKKYTEKSS